MESRQNPKLFLCQNSSPILLPEFLLGFKADITIGCKVMPGQNFQEILLKPLQKCETR